MWVIDGTPLNVAIEAEDVLYEEIPFRACRIMANALNRVRELCSSEKMYFISFIPLTFLIIFK
jgi:hypothetical protein